MINRQSSRFVGVRQEARGLVVLIDLWSVWTPKSHKESRQVKAGTIVVRTHQKLGTLAAFLLEPESEDGLITWNYFDTVLKERQDFPVLRLPVKTPMVLEKVKPLAEDRGPKKQLTPEMLDNGTLPNFWATPFRWRGCRTATFRADQGQVNRGKSMPPPADREPLLAPSDIHSVVPTVEQLTASSVAWTTDPDASASGTRPAARQSGP